MGKRIVILRSDPAHVRQVPAAHVREVMVLVVISHVEGDDASFATLAATTVLGNYTQISRKTVQISNTYDVVRKYGRKSEVAYQLMKAGKEMKRDMEYALVRNQASSAGGAATARTSAGIESWNCRTESA